MFDVGIESVTEVAGALEHFDVIVIGAGISGLVATSLLLEQGAGRVLVVDEYPQVGGNHIDCTIGDYTFDIGSLIFQDNSPLLRHFPELLAEYVPIDPRWGRLNPQGVVADYPLSVKADLIDAGPVEWGRLLASVLISRLFRRRIANARDFARYWIGARMLHRSGLEQYMERFYGQPAERIDLHFAEKRMGWIRQQAQLRHHVLRLLNPAAAAGPANTQLVRPKAGFRALYRPAVERLEARGATFRLGAQLRTLRRTGADLTLEMDGASASARRVVSTVPIGHAARLCGAHVEERLQTVTLITLFFSFAGERGFRQSILYNFSYDGAWKRLTVYSDFYGLAGGREYFAVEVNADNVDGSVAAAEADFRRHAALNGLFRGTLRLEGAHRLTNAYPVYTDNAADKVERALAAVRACGVESIGRQGLFDYQPTARDTTLKAEAAIRVPGTSVENKYI